MVCLGRPYHFRFKFLKAVFFTWSILEYLVSFTPKISENSNVSDGGELCWSYMLESFTWLTSFQAFLQNFLKFTFDEIVPCKTKSTALIK